MKSVTEILTIKLYYIDYKTPPKQASPVGVIAPDGANEVLGVIQGQGQRSLLTCQQPVMQVVGIAHLLGDPH